mgnify:CR=1 FL=1
MKEAKTETGLALYDEACKLDAGIVTPETEKTILAPLGKAIACLVLACKYIAQIVRALVYVLLIGIIVPNMIIPPSNGHSPEGLLFMGTLAIFLFSTVKLQLKFYDMMLLEIKFIKFSIPSLFPILSMLPHLGHFTLTISAIFFISVFKY